MSVENCIRSIEGDYLHFNRVDSYQDYQQRRRIRELLRHGDPAFRLGSIALYPK
jgi:hypothetical protein